jgi:hypothetical protein
MEMREVSGEIRIKGCFSLIILLAVIFLIAIFALKQVNII